MRLQFRRNYMLWVALLVLLALLTLELGNQRIHAYTLGFAPGYGAAFSRQ